MSMGVERQSAQYQIFDTGNEYYTRERRVATNEDVVAELLRGPRIQAGLLNTRTAAGFHVPIGLGGSGSEGIDNGPQEYQDSPEAMHGGPIEEDFGDDPEGMIPGSMVAPHPDPNSMSLGGGYDDYDPHSAENVEGQIGPYESFRSARSGGPASKTAAPMPAADPAAAGQQWLGHTFVPSHRVGMPWRGTTIPGTVTHLDGDGTKIGVRWDDGQHTVEEPSAIRPLY